MKTISSSWIVQKSHRQRTDGTNQKKNSIMIDLSPTISIITLNANCLNTPIKRQIVRLDKKEIHIYMILSGNPL